MFYSSARDDVPVKQRSRPYRYSKWVLDVFVGLCYFAFFVSAIYIFVKYILNAIRIKDIVLKDGLFNGTNIDVYSNQTVQRNRTSSTNDDDDLGPALSIFGGFVNGVLKRVPWPVWVLFATIPAVIVMSIVYACIGRHSHDKRKKNKRVSRYIVLAIILAAPSICGLIVIFGTSYFKACSKTELPGNKFVGASDGDVLFDGINNATSGIPLRTGPLAAIKVISSEEPVCPLYKTDIGIGLFLFVYNLCLAFITYQRRRREIKDGREEQAEKANALRTQALEGTPFATDYSTEYQYTSGYTAVQPNQQDKTKAYYSVNQVSV